jgi:hypothetical protein
MAAAEPRAAGARALTLRPVTSATAGTAAGPEPAPEPVVDAARARRRGSARLLALGDQVLSGLSNFLTVALVARSATPEEFGHFSLVYALLLIALGLLRGLWGTRLSLSASHGVALERARGLLGATALVTPLLVVVLLGLSLALTGLDAVAIALLIALALPIVVAQDLCRYAAVAAGRPGVAFASDLVWVLVVVAGYAARPSMGGALLTWVGAAALALGLALALLRIRPSLAAGRAALRERHRTGEVAALGSVAVAAAGWVGLGLATLSLGAAAAGALRGASTVMAPVNTLFAFVGLALLPLVHRAPAHRQPRLTVQLSAALAAAVVAWGALLLVVPDAVGELLLGASWPSARAVLPWTTVEYAALAVTLGGLLGLQARQASRVLLRLTVVAPTLVVMAALAATLVGDSPQAFAAALAGATVVSGVVVWVAHQRVVRGQPVQASS